MPALPPQKFVDAILDAIQESSWAGMLLNAPRNNPRRFLITKEDRSLPLCVYIWTLTPGGRPSLRHEFRVQMTGVSSPLKVETDGPTVIMGYEPSLKVFGGFDLQKHRVFTQGSPSVQIDVRTLQKALQDGLAFGRKDNDEITVGIRPDQFVNYVLGAQEFHGEGKSKATFDLLAKAAQPHARVTPADLGALSGPRQRLVQQVSRLSRSASFRQQILQAYDHRCAVTRMQLKLVDAAHILPVGAPGSTDLVCNGLALSPTIHRAYDFGLVFLNAKYEMKISEERADMLASLGLEGGLPQMKLWMGPIHLPPDKKQWPDQDIIRKANMFRNVK